MTETYLDPMGRRLNVGQYVCAFVGVRSLDPLYGCPGGAPTGEPIRVLTSFKGHPLKLTMCPACATAFGYDGTPPTFTLADVFRPLEA